MDVLYAEIKLTATQITGSVDSVCVCNQRPCLAVISLQTLFEKVEDSFCLFESMVPCDLTHECLLLCSSYPSRPRP